MKVFDEGMKGLGKEWKCLEELRRNDRIQRGFKGF
jgi:hypothetical protein